MDEGQMEGEFNQAKGQIRKTWGDVSDDDVDQTRGSFEKLVGTIQERSGEAVETIQEKLDGIFGDGKESPAR